MADVKIYTVTAVADYIPSIILATLDKETAIARGREYAGDWGNEQATESGELLFNQREEGSMENAVSVQETELATPHSADRGITAQITDVAEAILWNDGIEEYPAELVDFARVAIDVPESQQPGDKDPEGSHTRRLRGDATRPTHQGRGGHGPRVQGRHTGGLSHVKPVLRVEHRGLQGRQASLPRRVTQRPQHEQLHNLGRPEGLHEDRPPEGR